MAPRDGTCKYIATGRGALWGSGAPARPVNLNKCRLPDSLRIRTQPRIKLRALVTAVGTEPLHVSQLQIHTCLRMLDSKANCHRGAIGCSVLWGRKTTCGGHELGVRGGAEEVIRGWGRAG